MDLAQKLTRENEQTWAQMGSLAEQMCNQDLALYCFERSLHHNPFNVQSLSQIATICRSREQYAKATDFFQRVLNIENSNGEIWGALGHCFLMMDDLQSAYAAYQQALVYLPSPKDPKLWYGIGILYDRYRSWDLAQEAFNAVLKMAPTFDKTNEVYFRLGVIYKQQRKFEESIKCFQHIIAGPPPPLTEGDIWFQIGHVYELQQEHLKAKEAYEHALKINSKHAKVLQKLGQLHRQASPLQNIPLSIEYLERSIQADPNDPKTYHLLGQAYMESDAEGSFPKAYDAYQQAVCRDPQRPTFWSSIGVLYYKIGQARDALDCYSRALRLDPTQPDVWYNLGVLYASCKQQQDALDAFSRALELGSTVAGLREKIAQLTGALQHGQTEPPTETAPMANGGDTAAFPSLATAFPENSATVKRENSEEANADSMTARFSLSERQDSTAHSNGSAAMAVAVPASADGTEGVQAEAHATNGVSAMETDKVTLEINTHAASNARKSPRSPGGRHGSRSDAMAEVDVKVKKPGAPDQIAVARAHGSADASPANERATAHVAIEDGLGEVVPMQVS